MTKESVLLIGCGDIAQRLADLLDSTAYAITGLRRRKMPAAAITYVQGDCSDPLLMHKVLARDFAIIVVTLTPSSKGDQGYQQAYVHTTQCLLDTLSQRRCQPRLIVFVSSTSVYGQQAGEWVDEASVTLPTGCNGRRILEAEHLFRQSAFKTCCVRFSGIYGPGRQRLIEQVMAAKYAPANTPVSHPISYSNRIHADDCAGVLAHLITLDKTQALAPVYLASDCAPSPLHEVKHWLGRQLQLPDNPSHPCSPSAAADRGRRPGYSNKRCGNQRLLATGYQFHYPDYRAGYRGLLDAYIKR